ncbi:hypothetical protein JCGZ_03709 [Jatropha curcas]|uniref:RNase H type-1 domain-containing protein n=1 Tax=Jatropha curcas TaxID=180498 RepID=A0A067KTE5_JATCU|nr:hypothetical protein JCGZ_03709 [Jatropha curcas]
MVEMDSLECIRLVSSPDSQNLRFANIFHQCRMLIQKAWVVQFRHVYREGNKEADFLANMAVTAGSQDVILQQPPSELQSLLRDDLQGRGMATGTVVCV